MAMQSEVTWGNYRDDRLRRLDLQGEYSNKAFRAHKKNFYLIHKMGSAWLLQRLCGLLMRAASKLQGVPAGPDKTVAQCVEYYYTWKKRIRFTYLFSGPRTEKRVKRKLAEADPTETKATYSPKERPKCCPTPEFKIETKSCRRESMVTPSPNAAPKWTPEPPGSIQG
ncbi:Zinc finger protein 541 [Manis javanica]|nr:Zinc finger protein 541 [Manis javanica]